MNSLLGLLCQLQDLSRSCIHCGTPSLIFRFHAQALLHDQRFVGAPSVAFTSAILQPRLFRLPCPPFSVNFPQISTNEPFPSPAVNLFPPPWSRIGTKQRPQPQFGTKNWGTPGSFWKECGTVCEETSCETLLVLTAKRAKNERGESFASLHGGDFVGDYFLGR